MKKKMPVLLTFDLDGETLWRCRDPENANRPVTLSQGRYGPETGLPRILKLLDKYSIKATFFIPGFTVDQYPDKVREIDAHGHEIGNHSWTHIYPDKLPSREAELKEDMDCSNAIEKITGKRPKGYRSPAWEFGKYTIGIMKEMGFEYSSNMMDTEEIRYLDTGIEKTDMVEFPIHWVLDDAAYWLYSLLTPGKCMQPHTAVEQYWKEEFDAILEEFRDEVAETGTSDKCFVLTCHPQITGRPAKVRVLDRLIAHMIQAGDVEFLTGSGAAERFRKTHPYK